MGPMIKDQRVALEGEKDWPVVQPKPVPSVQEPPPPPALTVIVGCAPPLVVAGAARVVCWEPELELAEQPVQIEACNIM